MALEQTSNSVPLQSYTFPRRTCIVLGNERTGIPAEVLHFVDDCVEIPQFGRVRSLNVHVSGSLAIWKAREQDLI
jgi:tRNA guanosine-2'-O-methyltransferase